MINGEYFILDINALNQATIEQLEQLEGYYEGLKKQGVHQEYQNFDEHELIKRRIEAAKKHVSQQETTN
tara:strand:+ start:1003 stop:1209 length:207 start_codon:yes stop_codon:yes gene_type:complete